MVTEVDDPLVVFGNTLRGARRERGLSQEEMAMQCGLDRTYISGLERGRRNPTLRVLLIISTNLGMTLSELLASVKNQEILNE
jgi:transcriptional regulator with XRE-family HTH domain